MYYILTKDHYGGHVNIIRPNHISGAFFCAEKCKQIID